MEAIPSEYIIPSGTISISANGSYNVEAFASAEVSISGGARTLQKLAEYMVTENVSQIDITVTDQMRSCEVLYMEFSNLNHTEDWVYPTINNAIVGASGNSYTPKGTVNNAFFAISPIYKAPDYSPWVVMMGGSGITHVGAMQITDLTSINIKLYNSASVFQSGTVRIWGYVV